MNYAPSWWVYQQLTQADSGTSPPQDTPETTKTPGTKTKPAKKGRTR